MNNVDADVVVLDITPFSQEGASIFSHIGALSVKTLHKFIPPKGSINRIADWFRTHGFLVETQSEVGLCVSMRMEAAESLFGANFTSKRIKYIRNLERWQINADKALVIPQLSHLIERITIAQGSFELSDFIAPEPPVLERYHLTVPEGILNLSPLAKQSSVQRAAQHVKVAMVDSGHFPHPYFGAQNARITRHSAISHLLSDRDERGHGTAMSSVLLAVAHCIDLHTVKMADRRFGYPVAALQKAVSLKPDIINCSWGTYGFLPQVHLEAVNALAKGIQIVFAAGNGSTDRKTAMFQSVAIPEGITVGGVYVDPQGRLEVSDIASSFESDVYRGHWVPDLCGPCGRMPDAQFILFPTQPASDFDQRNGKSDGTRIDDGWLVSSGTSAATAWVSGHLALLLGQQPHLPVSTQKQLACLSALSVSCGITMTGIEANCEHPNRATGYGFLNNFKLDSLIG